jgi:hypothetical protein
MNKYLDYFDNYVSKGLMPIAVQKGTKQPVGKNWNGVWKERNWRQFFDVGNFEIGLLWNNNIVDVETDNEESNEFLNRLIGDVKRPIYKSQRSYHNLFITPHEKLTKVNLYGSKGQKIEIFGKKTFTMAPPSRHMEGGTFYQFVNDHWPPPPCPSGIKALYFQQKNIKIFNKEKISSLCSDCKKEFYIHKKRLCLEVKVFLNNNLKWKCVHCRKNYKVDIKEGCRYVKKIISRA